MAHHTKLEGVHRCASKEGSTFVKKRPGGIVLNRFEARGADCSSTEAHRLHNLTLGFPDVRLELSVNRKSLRSSNASFPDWSCVSSKRLAPGAAALVLRSCELFGDPFTGSNRLTESERAAYGSSDPPAASRRAQEHRPTYVRRPSGVPTRPSPPSLRSIRRIRWLLGMRFQG